MTWFGWSLLVIYLVSAVLNITMINQPRKPLTSDVVAVLVGIGILEMFAILTVGTGTGL